MDLWWPLLLIIGAVALILGPIVMLQPNRRQQELAKLRQAALQKGICVRLDNGDSKETPIAVYSLAWPVAVDIDHFYLKKQKFAHGLHFLDHWHWDGDGRPPENWLETLKKILQALPQDIVGIEGAKHSLGVFWLEKQQQTTLAMVDNLLRESQTALLNATDRTADQEILH